MKIIHVVHDFIPNIGGIQIAVFEIARRQAEYHEVEVYTGHPNNQYAKKEVIENITVFRFPSYAPNNSYHISIPLYKALKNIKGDVLHIHSFSTATSFSTYLALRGGRNGFKTIVFTPSFIEVATTPFRTFLHRIYDQIQKKLFFWSDRVICLSEYEKSVLHRKFKVPLSKMHVIPVGLNDSEFRECPPSERIYDFEILYAGRLEEHKNVQHVIYSLPKLIEKYPQKKIHFTVIGDGPYRKELERIIVKTGMKEYVSLNGFAPSRQELIKSYKRADVFVTLSSTESFGMTIIEALAAGRPVIISDAPPIKHVVEGNGFVISDFNQLSEKLEYIMTNKIKVNFDVEPYTWDTIERKTTKLYL